MFRRFALFFLLLSVFGTTQAGGFQVNLQSVRAAGMGHTGAGLYFDASAMYFNPGALSFVYGPSLNTGVNLIFAGISYREPAPGTYTAENESGVGTPFGFFFSHSIKRNFAAGLAVYTPFGSSVQYPDDWKGQFALREISLKTVFIQPTLSYNFLDQIGIGIGPVFALGSLKLRRALPLDNPAGESGEALLEGNGNGIGFNAGIMWSPKPKFNIGLSYRSQVKFRAENGDATFTVPTSVQDLFPSSTFSAEITLPATTTLGIGVYPTKNLTLAVDVNYVGWQVYERLAFDFAENTESLEDLDSPRNYENSWIFRVGAEYHKKLANKWEARLRGGVYYDLTPVQDGYTTPETPDSDKWGFSGGLSIDYYWFGGIDFSLLWVEGNERTDTNLETNFGGTWKARALIPGIGIRGYFPLYIHKNRFGRMAQKRENKGK